MCVHFLSDLTAQIIEGFSILAHVLKNENSFFSYLKFGTIVIISQILLKILIQVDLSILSHIVINRLLTFRRCFRLLFAMLLLNIIEHWRLNFSKPLHHHSHIRISRWKLDSQPCQLSVMHSKGRVPVLLHHERVIP